MGVGSPEYILLFRKLPSDTSKAYADCPVKKTKQDYTRGRWQIDAHAFWKSSGNRFPTREEIYSLPIDQVNNIYRKYDLDNVYDYEKHVEIAETMESAGKLPATFMAVNPKTNAPYVWDDINRMNTLNSKQSQKKLQQHICPLQIDVVNRLIVRYSNKGELVMDPFGGLMTVPYCAMQLDRKGYGVELNTEYYNDGCKYLKVLEQQKTAPTLFDFMDEVI